MEKLVPLTVTLPEEVFNEIEEHARSLYLSRSAVTRRLIIEHLSLRKAEVAQAQPEAAA